MTLERGGDGLLGRDGDGVDDHAGLGALDLVDLAGLLLDGEVAVDDAHAALLGHGDGQARLGDGVHGGGHQRGVEGDVAGELGLGADLGGNDFAVGGDEEDIVEGQGFCDRGFNHDFWPVLSRPGRWRLVGGGWLIVESRRGESKFGGGAWRSPVWITPRNLVCRVLCRFCMYPPPPYFAQILRNRGFRSGPPCSTSRCKKVRRVPDFGLLPGSILAGVSRESIKKSATRL